LNKIDFVFCVHNHQPVGNFGFVLEEAFRKAYLPFLEVLSGHPSVKVVLHNSGALLEWVERAHPEYFDLVRGLAARGQLELLTGGFYEPVMSSVPDADKVGQTKKLTDYVKDKFGFAPKGLWLAERVWEPSLPSVLASAGVEYTVVDDSHFKSAGLEERDLLGYYLTEDQGAVIRVFSGSKRLRYLIPYADPAETLRYLGENSSGEEGRLLVLADDGEKFGVWPGTYSLCYEQKWLERFLTAIEENSHWINSVTFSEHMARRRPLGWVFLPTASYAEMMEWCLPVEAQLKYRAFLHKLGERGELSEYESFVKGGFWRNFLSRYPESNWMYKRMLFGRRVATTARGRGITPEVRRKALNEIWRAQCNCAYWHGVFGGLYLPHLREAIYRHVIRAENILFEAEPGAGSVAELLSAGAPALADDIDGDGEAEVVLSNRDSAFYVSPARGGTLVELDHRGRELNLLNNLARRREAYHSRIASQNPHRDDGKAASIHDAVTTKEGHLERYLVYDRLPRSCLLDHFLPTQTSLDEVVKGSVTELGTFAGAAYEERPSRGKRGLLLFSRGSVRSGAGVVGLGIEKALFISGQGASLSVEYKLDFDAELRSGLLFAPELNLHFSSPTGARAVSESVSSAETVLALDRPTESRDFKTLRIKDANFRLTAVLSAEGAARLWQFPVETVSLSESGLERVYQATCIIPAWSLEPGLRAKTLRLQIVLESDRPS
jgi:alpha-amylase